MTEEERVYLNNKHRGGINNAKGNRHESFFATRTIARLLHQYRGNCSAVKVQSQVPDAFVDDFLICEDTKNTYHQIKDVQDLKWDTGQPHSVKFDFTKQKELCESRNEEFSLRLVHSHSSDDVDSIPQDLQGCTTVELFPVVSNMNHFVISSIDFQDDLRHLLINGLDSPLDRLSFLSYVISGFWDYGCAPEALIQLDSFDFFLFTNFPDYVGHSAIQIDPRCEEIFHRLEAQYGVNGNSVIVRKDGLEAIIDVDSGLQERIIESKPKTFDELFNMVN